MNIKTYVISRPKELIYKDNVQEYYPLNSENIVDIFDKSDIIINTIPFNVIPEEALLINNKPYILDIASYPYGINEDIIKKYKNPTHQHKQSLWVGTQEPCCLHNKEKINYKLYLGIPSTFAPKKASEILLKILYKKIGKD